MPTQHHRLSRPVAIAKDREQRMRLNHETRNALSIILLTIDAFQAELFGPVTKTQTEALTTIQENTTRLQVALEAILSLLVEERHKRYE